MLCYNKSLNIEYNGQVSEAHYSTLQYNTVHYSTVQYSTLQYSTVPFGRNTSKADEDIGLYRIG